MLKKRLDKPNPIRAGGSPAYARSCSRMAVDCSRSSVFLERRILFSLLAHAEGVGGFASYPAGGIAFATPSAWGAVSVVSRRHRSWG